MAGALQLIARLQTAPVPPVPPCKKQVEPLEAAPLLEVPPVPPVPPQKRNFQNQCSNTAQGAKWLARFAGLLGCSPDYLLDRGFVDHHDLAEQHQQPPRFAARLIRTHPDWLAPAEFRAQYARAREEACGPQHIHHTAATASPAWTAARDAFHAHALGGCPQCCPSSGRYCVTGAELRQRYEKTPIRG